MFNIRKKIIFSFISSLMILSLVAMPALAGFAYGAVAAVLFNLAVKLGGRWICPLVGAVRLNYRE